MASSKKRCLSDVQADDCSFPQQIDDHTYRTMVLRFEQTEDEVDHHFLQTALELGINIPQDPETTLELVTRGISGLNINVELSEPVLPAHSRASQSIYTASDSSIEQSRHVKTPSLAATSITSASSVASNTSNIVKVRKGFRRLSRLHRRRNLIDHVPDIPPRASSALAVNSLGLQSLHSMTTDLITTISDPPPHAMTTDQTHTVDGPPPRVQSVTDHSPLPPPPTDTSSPLSEEECLEALAGRRRSISNPVLKKLRTTQLQEQLRFISFEASQHRLIRNKQLQHKRDALKQYHQQKKDAHTRHAEALVSLENRHLTAEVELHRTLQLERQACDVRLKHMQAYCNPRSTVQGMPSRVVTKADYRQLEQQYHTRNGMDNLHTSRINVLRERQGKQSERIIAKQETELNTLESEFEDENQDLDAKSQEEDSRLQQEFADRKARLVARWRITEAIERHKLELQTGDDYGPLPLITWSSDAEDRDSNPVTPVSSVSSGSPVSSRGKSREGYLQEAD